MLTWSEHGNWVKADAAADQIRGPQRLKAAVWYATGATAGTTALLLSEVKSGASLCPAIAEAAQLVKSLEVPAGLIEGIAVTTMAAGYVMLYFEERDGLSAKRIHDDTPEAAE